MPSRMSSRTAGLPPAPPADSAESSGLRKAIRPIPPGPERALILVASGGGQRAVDHQAVAGADFHPPLTGVAILVRMPRASSATIRVGDSLCLRLILEAPRAKSLVLYRANGPVTPHKILTVAPMNSAAENGRR